jgi:hypothetical protein
MPEERLCPTCGCPTQRLYRDTAWPPNTEAVCCECLVGYCGADWVAQKLAYYCPQIQLEEEG